MHSIHSEPSRNPNPRKPIRAYNTTQVGRGGDQSGRYHADAGWESIDAARLRSANSTHPGAEIESLITSLRTRLIDIQAWSQQNPSPKMMKTWKQGTHERVKKIRALLDQYHGSDSQRLIDDLNQTIGE